MNGARFFAGYAGNHFAWHRTIRPERDTPVISRARRMAHFTQQGTGDETASTAPDPKIPGTKKKRSHKKLQDQAESNPFPIQQICSTSCSRVAHGTVAARRGGGGTPCGRVTDLFTTVRWIIRPNKSGCLTTSSNAECSTRRPQQDTSRHRLAPIDTCATSHHTWLAFDDLSAGPPLRAVKSERLDDEALIETARKTRARPI